MTLTLKILTVLCGLLCHLTSQADAVTIKRIQNNRLNSALSENEKTEQSANLAKKIRVTIIAPPDNMHIHNFNPLIPIKTAPELKQSDDVYVSVNDKPIKAVYKNDTWNMRRPYPGKNVIYLAGETSNNKKFYSNSIIVYIHNTNVTKNTS